MKKTILLLALLALPAMAQDADVNLGSVRIPGEHRDNIIEFVQSLPNRLVMVTTTNALDPVVPVDAFDDTLGTPVIDGTNVVAYVTTSEVEDPTETALQKFRRTYKADANVAYMRRVRAFHREQHEEAKRVEWEAKEAYLVELENVEE